MLTVTGDLVDLLQQVVDVESVSGNEGHLADMVEQALRDQPHLDVARDGDCVVARTHLGRQERVVIAGHLDTVPVAANLPSVRRRVDGEDRVYGRGSCDMKGGVAVALAVAAAVAEPVVDVTWVFYDHEEVASELNGLGRMSRTHPDVLDAAFAVLMEPSNALVEAGCQGTLRVCVRTRGTASHSARSWLGVNAIHAMAGALDQLATYRPRTVTIDGLDYREGLNAVGITGGIATNVIPDSCELVVNYRFAPDLSGDEAVEHVRTVFAGYEVEVCDLAPGALPGLHHRAAADFLRAVGAEPRPKYGWTDVARFAELGIPAVNYGPANPDLAHTDHEYVPVAQLETCAAGLTGWLTGRPVASR